MVIRRIGVIKLAVVEAGIGVVLGLLIALCMLLFGSIIGAAFGQRAGLMGMAGGVVALIVLPIVYGVGMFIAGLISAAIYNLVARVVGGIEIDTA